VIHPLTLHCSMDVMFLLEILLPIVLYLLIGIVAVGESRGTKTSYEVVILTKREDSTNFQLVPLLDRRSSTNAAQISNDCHAK